MIIWRGFGFVAVILGALGALLGITLSGLVVDDGVNGLLLGLGLVIGGAATFALGWWLNVVKPAQKAEAWTTQRRAELSHAVAAGAAGQRLPSAEFAPAPQVDPKAQAEAVLAHESAQVAKRLRNVHTLFWIPIQWWGVLFALLGILLAIVLTVG